MGEDGHISLFKVRSIIHINLDSDLTSRWSRWWLPWTTTRRTRGSVPRREPAWWRRSLMFAGWDDNLARMVFIWWKRWGWWWWQALCSVPWLELFECVSWSCWLWWFAKSKGWMFLIICQQWGKGSSWSDRWWFLKWLQVEASLS